MTLLAGRPAGWRMPCCLTCQLTFRHLSGSPRYTARACMGVPDPHRGMPVWVYGIPRQPSSHRCPGRTRGQLGPTWGRPGPRDRSQRRDNGRGMPGGRFSGPGDHSGPISVHFRRFRARPLICDLNIVTLPQLRLLRFQHWHSGDF